MTVQEGNLFPPQVIPAGRTLAATHHRADSPACVHGQDRHAVADPLLELPEGLGLGLAALAPGGHEIDHRRAAGWALLH